MIFVDSVLDFLPWCSSNGLTCSSVCIVKHITLNARFILSVKPIFLSRLASHIFLAFLLRVQPPPYRYVVSIGFFSTVSFLQNILYSSDMNALLLSDFIFSRTPEKIMKLSKNLMTFLFSPDSHNQTTGHLLDRTILVRRYGSPVTSALCNSPEKSICVSCPVSVNTGDLIFFVDGNWYFKLLPELMHALHVLHLFSMSFFNPDYQIYCFFASIFVEPGCPKCSASTTCHSSSSGTTVLSPANSKPNCSVISLKTGDNSSAALSFCLFLTNIFNCSNLGSTEFLWIEVFRSIMKLNSAFLIFFRLRCSSFSGFQSHGWRECYLSSFQRYHNLWGPRWKKWAKISPFHFPRCLIWVRICFVLLRCFSSLLIRAWNSFWFVKFKITSALPVVFSISEHKSQVACGHFVSPSLVRSSGELYFSIYIAVEFEPTVFMFYVLLPPSIKRRVSGLFFLLLIIFITFLFVAL